MASYCHFTALHQMCCKVHVGGWLKVTAEEDLRMETSCPLNEATAVFMLKNLCYHHTSHSDEPLSYRCYVCCSYLYLHCFYLLLNVFHKNKSRCRDGAKHLQRACVPAWKNQLVEKLQEQGGVPFHAQQPRLKFSGIKDTLDACSPSLYTSGNICGCVYAHAIGKIELGKAIKKYKSSRYIAICQSSL